MEQEEVSVNTGRNRRSYTPVEFSVTEYSGGRSQSTEVEPRDQHGRRRRSDTIVEFSGSGQRSYLEPEEEPRKQHGRRRRSDTFVEFTESGISGSEFEEQTIEDRLQGLLLPPTGYDGIIN